jgi:hypothetical protein
MTLSTKRQIIGWSRKYLVKPRECIETPLTAAFRKAADAAPKRQPAAAQPAPGNWTKGLSSLRMARRDAQLSTLPNPCR